MPRYTKHNDAVDYSKRPRPSFNTFTQKEFCDLIDKIRESSGYKMITWDSYGTKMWKDEAIVKIHVKGEWE